MRYLLNTDEYAADILHPCAQEASSEQLASFKMLSSRHSLFMGAVQVTAHVTVKAKQKGPIDASMVTNEVLTEASEQVVQGLCALVAASSPKPPAPPTPDLNAATKEVGMPVLETFLKSCQRLSTRQVAVVGEHVMSTLPTLCTNWDPLRVALGLLVDKQDASQVSDIEQYRTNTEQYRTIPSTQISCNTRQYRTISSTILILPLCLCS